MITTGKKVCIEYRVTLPDGTEVDANVGESLTFIQGSHTILPALEDALEGVEAGSNLQIQLNPEQAFGLVEDEYFQAVSLDLVPEDLRYRGAELSVEDEDGEFYKASLHQLAGNEAVLDFNHPLAGHTLVFELDVLEVNENPYLN